MKKLKDMKKTQPENIEEIDMGKFGLSELKRSRKTALELVPLCQMNEAIKKKKGFVWMTKEKTSKFVHPDNVKKNLADGWRISKKQKK